MSETSVDSSVASLAISSCALTRAMRRMSMSFQNGARIKNAMGFNVMFRSCAARCFYLCIRRLCAFWGGKRIWLDSNNAAKRDFPHLSSRHLSMNKGEIIVCINGLLVASVCVIPRNCRAPFPSRRAFSRAAVIVTRRDAMWRDVQLGQVSPLKNLSQWSFELFTA